MAPLDWEEGERWFSQAQHTLASGQRDLDIWRWALEAWRGFKGP
ncbi:hypothetical protein [Thermus amyloliquefaciens]|nr:hypothetical protein [Thermus amyloliquefaciens]